MWEVIDKYLTDLAKILGVPRSYLVFLRYDGPTHKKPLVITAQNADSSYLKPDTGYGARLNRYEVRDVISNQRSTPITSFGLYEFPSCCAFCVSTQAFVHEQFRRKGINKLTNTLRQYIAKKEGYTALICTDIESNVPQRKTLQANGFKDIYDITNKRTRNHVFISVKEL